MSTVVETYECSYCGMETPEENEHYEECGACDSEHYGCGEDCPTVTCSDCGCEHLGDEDKCPCESGYCEACECQPDEEFYAGCAACYWWYEQGNGCDPCEYDNTGEAYTECAYYSAFMTHLDGPEPEHHFSVRHLESRSASEVDAHHEHGVAIQLGLDPHMDLSTACADFYILERLFHNSHDLSSRYDTASKRSVYEPTLPMHFGKGDEHERLAYAIERTRKSLNDELAKQLFTYMVMAVGGELRHAPTRATRTTRTRGTPKRLWPKSKNRRPWLAFKSNRMYFFEGGRPCIPHIERYGCPACVSYTHYARRHKERVSEIYPCNRTYFDYADKEHVRPATHANPGCMFFAFWCKRNNIKPRKTKTTLYLPHNERLRGFFGRYEYGERDRGLAWRSWLQLYEDYGPPLLQDCEDVFAKWEWGSSYGGKKWGEATHFALLFAKGEMSAAAFLDRVWTLEHNGGNLFNKFYQNGIHNLPVVLQKQADDEAHYPNLIRDASNYTKGLYRDAERLGVLKRTPEIVWG